MPKTPKTPTPESIFEAAMEDAGPSMKVGELNLLASGLLALKERQEKKLNERELTSIYALIAYVAHEQDVEQNTVAEVLKSHFNVEELELLPAVIYQAVIEYLIDLDMNKVTN